MRLCNHGVPWLKQAKRSESSSTRTPGPRRRSTSHSSGLRTETLSCSPALAAFKPSGARGLALAAERNAIASDAARFRLHTHAGEAIGRIVIHRIGLNMVVVDGTDESSLKKGPGRDLRTYMPGQNRLVYIAGHRTTYLAPFSHIDAIRPGDVITLEMPYATFTYRTTRHRIVAASNLAVLRSPRHELLELQACHPRFFATHRYIVYAQLVAMTPRA